MEINNKFIRPFQWILDDKYRILYHLLFWLVMYLDEFLSLVGVTEPIEGIELVLLELLADVIIVYLNFYVLIPRLLMKGKIYRYLFFTLFSILVVILIDYYIWFDPEFADEFSFITFFISIFISTLTLLGTAVGIKIFKMWFVNHMKISELQTKTLEAELNSLKSQINPHFLFNSLNNIYVLSRKRPEEASESILLLSDILRYQLYDCAREKVLLKDEIANLENYLELDKIRKSGTIVNFEIKGRPGNIELAPFLFLPFVENAIKHGVSTGKESAIDIEMEISGSRIQFDISNDKSSGISHEKVGGIGLQNVRRRLELLYPGKHQLTINETDNKYSVTLILDT